MTMGETVNFQILARDISDRKRAENEKQLLAEIIEGAVITPDPVQFLKFVHRLIGPSGLCRRPLCMCSRPRHGLGPF